MSAYLSSNDCLNALTTYWELRSDQGADNARDQLARAFAWFVDTDGKLAYSHYHGIDQALRAIDRHGSAAHAVFQQLLGENIRSLEARYPGSHEMWEAATDYRFRRSSAVLTWTACRPHGHGNVVGLLRGYEYQSCEHNNWEQSTAWQITSQIERFLLDDLQRRDCGSDAPWACWTEVPAAGGPVLLSKLSD